MNPCCMFIHQGTDIKLNPIAKDDDAAGVADRTKSGRAWTQTEANVRGIDGGLQKEKQTTNKSPHFSKLCECAFLAPIFLACARESTRCCRAPPPPWA